MLRIALVVFMATVIRMLMLARWDAYKERKSREALPMKLNRKGVHVPWGSVQKIEFALNCLFWAWLAWMAAMLCTLAWTRFTG